jgi:polyisoprenoid-binding protein YceI
MHRKLLATFAVAALLSPAILAADTYKIDRSHSDVSFRIRHLVSNVTGRFNEFQGEIKLDSSDLTRSSVSFTIQAKSVDTSEPKRDEHLRTPDFFDVAKYPEITFVSTGIVKGSGDVYQVKGRFTMHGVEKEITIPVEYLGAVKDPWGNEKAGFAASLTLNRKDYGIVWNKALDTGNLILGDEVQVTINLEAVKSKSQESK